jgi:hypothetical protein
VEFASAEFVELKGAGKVGLFSDSAGRSRVRSEKRAASRALPFPLGFSRLFFHIVRKLQCKYERFANNQCVSDKKRA